MRNVWRLLTVTIFAHIECPVREKQKDLTSVICLFWSPSGNESHPNLTSPPPPPKKRPTAIIINKPFKLPT